MPDTTTAVTIGSILAAAAAAAWRYLHIRVGSSNDTPSPGPVAITPSNDYGRRLGDLQKTHDELKRDYVELRHDFDAHVLTVEPVQRDYIMRGARIDALEREQGRDQAAVDREAAKLERRLEIIDARITALGGRQ